MKKREKRGKEYWALMIQEHLKSGLTQKAFAEQHGLCQRTLADWRNRLGIPLKRLKRRKASSRKKKLADTLTFVELNAFKPPLLDQPPSLVKCEISLPHGPTLKVVVGATWDQVSAFLQTLVGSENALPS